MELSESGKLDLILENQNNLKRKRSVDRTGLYAMAFITMIATTATGLSNKGVDAIHEKNYQNCLNQQELQREQLTLMDKLEVEYTPKSIVCTKFKKPTNFIRSTIEPYRDYYNLQK